MKKRITLIIFVIFSFIATISLVASNYAFALNDPGGGGGGGADSAEITDAYIRKNALYYTLQQCYTDSNTLRTTISYVGKTYTSVLTTDAQIFKGDKEVRVPTGFYDDETIRCSYKAADLIHGEKKGVVYALALEAKNKSKLTVNPSNPSSRTAFYEGMGYTASSQGEQETGTVDGEDCLYYTYTYNGQEGATNGICFKLSGDSIVSAKNDTTYLNKINGAGIVINAAFDGTYFGSSTSCTNPGVTYCYGGGTQSGYFSAYIHADDGAENASFYAHNAILDGVTKDISYSDIKDWFRAVEENTMQFFISSGVTNDTFKNLTTKTYKLGGGGGETPQADMDTYTISNGNVGYNTAYKYLDGEGSASLNASFDNTEMYYIYMSYLKNKYNVTIDYTDCQDTDGGEKYLPVVIKENDVKSLKYCLMSNYSALEGSNHREKVNTTTSWGQENVFFTKIVEYIKGLSGLQVSRLPANQLSETVLPTDPGEDPGVKDEEKEKTCYDNAGSLGWILCPIIDSVSKFVLNLYVEWVEPSLMVNPKLFDTNSNKGTYDAWCVFRDIANVLFVILFIFVIFSQLTGVGINNYGIKKILPKLIVGAILINMSYIVCQLAIDVANIVGRGIGGLFQGISDQIGTVTEVTAGDYTVGSDGWTSFWSSAWNPIIVIVVAVFATAAVLSKGLAIIVPALMLVISIGAAVFGLIVILGIRQALTVILVAVSPIAFACYMLPNTKGIFDKWFSLLKGLLIAYPICSAMIYGGDMVGNILLHSAGPNDTWIMISAAIISVAPVFFIPKVLSASMGALSRGVMRMSGGLGNWGKGKLGRSGFAMDMNRRSQMQKAGVKFDKNGNAKYTTWGKLQNKMPRSRSSKQRLDMARRQAAMGQAQMGQAGIMMGAAGLSRMTNMQKAAQAGQADQDVRDTQMAISLGDGEAYSFDKDGNAELEYDKNGEAIGFKKVKVNASDVDSLQEGLRTALVTGNTNDIKAYQNILAGRGDAGRKAIMQAMVDAQGSGAKFGSTNSKGVSNEAVQAYSQNIMDNYAKDFKENARSVYNFANANQSIEANDRQFLGSPMGSAEYATKASSLKASQIGNMDDDELNSILTNVNSLEQGIKNGTIVGDDADAAQQEIDAARAAASEALADSTIRGSIKQGNISKLKEINGGIDPVLEQKAAQEAAASAVQAAQEAQTAAIDRINEQLKKRDVHTEVPRPVILDQHGNPFRRTEGAPKPTIINHDGKPMKPKE